MSRLPDWIWVSISGSGVLAGKPIIRGGNATKSLKEASESFLQWTLFVEDVGLSSHIRSVSCSHSLRPRISAIWLVCVCVCLTTVLLPEGVNRFRPNLARGPHLCRHVVDFSMSTMVATVALQRPKNRLFGTFSLG